ncbi:SET domain-containing protein [Paraburkholderia sp. J67]|uniref:SET domain-containing protein n=1 Tax=Paraburkholderia sp. J67 TaxID=2805435 RepID=UPI002ABE4F08|nr:SET domain-containing protein-lysine N-methyltransferase [Paraburkholderia sp. J67]
MKRVSVRQSPVHGKGVFALCPLAAGERIFQYKGMVTTWREAARWNARRDVSGHTFLFGLSDGRVIDGGRGGNGARWLNHACAANCEAVEDNGRVYIEAIRDIAPGEELFIDYALEIEEQVDAEAQRDYACRCGNACCRGTMLGAGAGETAVVAA